ncbi:MAG TPA: HD domain-containing protein [Phycisphaerales bacterium]|nr:HD domain-containing protein [Phycisphaerales bacterium]
MAKRSSPKQQPRPLWQEAAAFAARAHRHQIRKDDKTPYVSHVFRVAMTVSQVFGCSDETVLAAALLHDTIEDTTTDYDDLEERFGREVADTVAALTKNMALPEDEREDEYDARLARADWRARLIKLADTYDNYCDVVNQPKDVQKKKLADSKDKCRRALTLAQADRGNEFSDCATAAVKSLIA